MRVADIEDILHELENWWQNITNLPFANNTALIAGNLSSMTRILNRVDVAGKTVGFNLNAMKTEGMHVGKSKNQKHQTG